MTTTTSADGEGQWRTLDEIRRAAHAATPNALWDYLEGGAGSERTLRWNRAAFDTLALVPRVLTDVTQRSTEVAFLGHRLTMPVLLAPIGSVGEFDPDGALVCARAAQSAGTAAIVSIYMSSTLESVREAVSGPLFAQIYVRGDRGWLHDLLERLHGVGYDGVCLTVDSPVYGSRRRDIENRFDLSGAWRSPNLPSTTVAEDNTLRARHQAALTWDDVAWMKQLPLPVMVKGILAAEDAATAASLGVDVVYVSNHGGRQLDSVPPTIGVLPEVVAAVAGRCTVVVDGGVRDSTDVLKALALGADAVALGRPALWALRAGGQPALAAMFRILQQELQDGLALLGVRTPEQLGAEHIRTHPLDYRTAQPVDE